MKYLTYDEPQFDVTTATREEIIKWINAAADPRQRRARKNLCYYRLYSIGPHKLRSALKD